MKYLDIDWTAFFPFADVWEGLDAGQRTQATYLSTSGALNASRYGRNLEVLADAGMLEIFKGGTRVRAPQAFKPALKVLRFMSRTPIFGSEGVSAVYLRELLTSEEYGALGDRRGWIHPQVLLPTVASEGYLESFLEGDAAAWEIERIPEGRASQGVAAERALLTTKGRIADLRKLLSVLAARPEPIPIRALPSELGRMSRRRLADAILAGLRYVLCVAGFDEQGTPALGLWPEVSARLHRAQVGAPEPANPSETCEVPWAFHDLLQTLAFIGEPHPVRASDGRLFVKAQRELEGLLQPHPAWIRNDWTLEYRVEDAMILAADLELMETASRGRAGSQVQLSDAGRTWLAEEPRARAQGVFDHLRFQWRERVCFDVAGYVWQEGTRYESEAFRDLRGPVRVGEFLEYQARSSNPLPMHHGRTRVWKSDDALEFAWKERLRSLIDDRLVPFGGLRVGRLGEERTIELTDLGRYLLGHSEAFAWPDEVEQASMVVQPDFEILFLEPSPTLEAEVTRFAERTGRGVGVLFRLTRAAVQGGIRAGLTLDQILACLVGSSRSGLPENVERELRTWAGSVVRLDLETAQIIRCTDEETATRVLAASKGRLRLLAPTVLVLEDAGKRAELIRECRKAGVFLDAEEPERPKRRRARRKRSRWREYDQNW